MQPEGMKNNRGGAGEGGETEGRWRTSVSSHVNCRDLLSFTVSFTHSPGKICF